MLSASRSFFIRLTFIVVVWYIAQAYLPQLVGTCLDGDCGFTGGEIMVSLVIPFTIAALIVLLEMRLYRKNLPQALSDIGLIRFSWAGIRIAAIYLLPLLLFFPLFSLLTNTPMSTQANWQWLVLSALLNNGLVEETLMRGFVFRHIREGNPFWRAAVLSTVYFAAYHVVLIFTTGPLIGSIAVIIAIPSGLLTAYIYERGNNTIWGPALFHALYNSAAFVFVFPTDIQPAASSLYLVLGIIVSTGLLVSAYRAGYERQSGQAVHQTGLVGGK